MITLKQYAHVKRPLYHGHELKLLSQVQVHYTFHLNPFQNLIPNQAAKLKYFCESELQTSLGMERVIHGGARKKGNYLDSFQVLISGTLYLKSST